MNIYTWQQELLDNPPRVARLNFSPQEWEDIVLNELFESNVEKGEAHPFYGKTHSEETKKRMSEVKKGKFKGEAHPFYGKTHSEETKREISKACKGKPKSDETKRRMRKPKSEEHKLNISEALKGEKNPMYGKKPSEEHKRKLSDAKRGKKQPKITCPHCGRVGGVSLMHRWHFENCKDRSNT